MASTVQQRKVAEEKMIETMRSATAHFSQRSLSFRGKVTILNTLILSKVWYSLRLLRVTTKTLETIQSLCYQFVWMGKTPRLAFDTICLPRTQGRSGGHQPLPPLSGSTDEVALCLVFRRKIIYSRYPPSSLCGVTEHGLSSAILLLFQRTSPIRYLAPNVNCSYHLQGFRWLWIQLRIEQHPSLTAPAFLT